MKLAKIILPLLGNDGSDLFMQHQKLKYVLLQSWGGYTSHPAMGGWKSSDGNVLAESVVVYEIAMDRADTVALRELGVMLARDCHQESVMIVTPGGDVEFVHAENKRLTPIAAQA